MSRKKTYKAESTMPIPTFMITKQITGYHSMSMAGVKSMPSPIQNRKKMPIVSP
jgi:hypothetical protein